MTNFRFSLEKAQRFDDRIGEWPVEIEYFPSSSPDKLDAAHLRMESIEFSAKVGERDRLLALGLLLPFFDGSKRVGIRKDLGRLFQCFVLVHGNKHRRRTTVTGDDDVLPQIRHTIDDLSEFAAELSDRNSLAHGH